MSNDFDVCIIQYTKLLVLPIMPALRGNPGRSIFRTPRLLHHQHNVSSSKAVFSPDRCGIGVWDNQPTQHIIPGVKRHVLFDVLIIHAGSPLLSDSDERRNIAWVPGSCVIKPRTRHGGCQREDEVRQPVGNDDRTRFRKWRWCCSILAVMSWIKAASCSVSIPKSFLGSATGETWVGGSQCHQGASILLPKALQTTKAPAFLGDGFVFIILLPLVRLCRGGCHNCLELARPVARQCTITYGAKSPWCVFWIPRSTYVYVEVDIHKQSTVVLVITGIYVVYFDLPFSD